jgi:hypothetical protein
MPQIRFEPTFPVFERAKNVHALDRAIIVSGLCQLKDTNYPLLLLYLLSLIISRKCCYVSIREVSVAQFNYP